MNSDTADRPGVAGAAARRDLCCAQLLRRQGAARAADQGRVTASRRRADRRDQSLRRLQQPSPAAPRATTTCASTTRRLTGSTSCPSGTRITAEYAPGEVIEVTQHDGSCYGCASSPTATTPATGWPRSAISTTHHDRGEILTGLLYVDPDSRRPARAPEHGRDAAESPGRSRAVPGLGRTGRAEFRIELSAPARTSVVDGRAEASAAGLT